VFNPEPTIFFIAYTVVLQTICGTFSHVIPHFRLDQRCLLYR